MYNISVNKKAVAINNCLAEPFKTVALYIVKNNRYSLKLDGYFLSFKLMRAITILISVSINILNAIMS